MLLSDVHLSDVCLSHTSGLSREQRPRKTKIGTEVAHVTRDSNTTFSVKRLRSPGRFGWLFKSLHNVHRWDQSLCHCQEWAAGCRSWIFMVQGALGAAGVKCVGYGLEVGHSVRTVGGAGAYCVTTIVIIYYSNACFRHHYAHILSSK